MAGRATSIAQHELVSLNTIACKVAALGKNLGKSEEKQEMVLDLVVISNIAARLFPKQGRPRDKPEVH